MDQKSPSQPPPSYSTAVHGESSYDYGPSSTRPASAPADVHGPMVQGPDITYLKSVGGIVKIVEAVSCLIGFIIDITVYYPGSGFASFSTINGFIQALIWFFLRLVHALPQILANYYIEFIMCCLIVIFLFISFILSAASGWMDAAIGAVCFFCFVALVAYGIDVFCQVRDIRTKFVARRRVDGQEEPVVQQSP